MTNRRLGGVAVLAAALSVLATVASGQSTPLPVFKSPEDAVVLIRGERPPFPLSTAMGVVTCWPPEEWVCRSTTVGVHRPRLHASEEIAVLVFEQPQQGTLVVLSRGSDGCWRWRDSLPLSFPYKPLSMEFRCLVAPPLEDIVIHDNCAYRGTGLFLGHLLVVRYVDGKLRVVLAATESERADPVGGQPLDAVSRFAFEPFRPTAEGVPVGMPARIIQKTSGRRGGRTFSEGREYVWQGALGVFAPEIRNTFRVR
jgi:hypothetical protein